MTRYQSIAFVFPGQGAQYPGMVKDFYDTFPEARDVVQEADDLLKRKLSAVIFDGPEAELTETKNSQLGIYTASMAILKTVEKLFPQFKPSVCAGLSLGDTQAARAFPEEFVAAMAAAAWTSRFPRYRTGIGAMMFLASDLFIFAGEGEVLPKDVTMWLVWPLYFAGQALIAWGVVRTLGKE